MNSEQVPWSLRDVSKVISLFVFILFLFWVILVFLIRVSFPSPIILTFAMVFLYTCLILVVWYFGVRRYNVSWPDLGLKAFNFWSSLGTAILLMFFIIFLSLLQSQVLAILKLEPKVDMSGTVIELFGKSSLGVVLFIGLAVIVAPLSEEIFFRGFLYPALRKKIGVRGGIFVSALIFALFHFNFLYALPLILIMGIILAYLYEKRGSLGPSIILHSLNNLFFSLVMVYFLFVGKP